MDELRVFELDWHSMLMPKIPLLDVVARSCFVFVALQVGMRLLGRKNMGHSSSYNTVTLFLMGAFGGRSVLGEDTSMTSCMLGLCVILALNGALNWAIFHSPRFAALMEGPVVQQLVRDGIVLRHNLHEARCSEEILRSQARGRGIQDLDCVKDAYLERTGDITFVLH